MASRNEHSKRSACPLACALDVIGDHWTLLIIRDMLIFNLHEYKDFLESAEGISSNILSNRLSNLEQQGLISFTPHPHNKKRKLYYLTHKGKDLIHVLIPLGRWSYLHLDKKPPSGISLLKHEPQQLIEHLLTDVNRWEQEMGVKTQESKFKDWGSFTSETKEKNS